MKGTSKRYVEVLLPLALAQSYTYAVPEHLKEKVQFGVRVEVALNRKLYAGLAVSFHDDIGLEIKPKDIISVIDDRPIILEYQYTFWQWIARYYCCTLGEVMNVALPSGLKLNSETKVVASQLLEDQLAYLEDDEGMVADAIFNNNELGIEDIRTILNKKTVYPVIKSLLDKELIFIREELKQKYKAKTADFVCLSEIHRQQDKDLNEALELTKRSEKQTNALLAYASLSPAYEWISKQSIYKKSGADASVINALVKKGIFLKEARQVSRIEDYLGKAQSLKPLSTNQEEALKAIRKSFQDHRTTLLFGVTGSGKTRLYMELMQETIDRGEQVLFLIPEIALTTQLVQRLQAIFGKDIGVYHSRLNQSKRVELYQSAMEGQSIFVGARSSIFLPFKNLGLIIVDEEHDASYKQSEPSPRYQGRDTALYLSKLFNAKVILGSATPSLESYQNALDDKYGLVTLHERYGEATLPAIEIVDLRKKYKQGLMRAMFSDELLSAVKTALNNKEQVLLFQNRRGYSPTIQCTLCNWNAECPNCDVSLTTHKYFQQINCHYCGYHTKIPTQCPQCGNTHLVELGFGTEKIAAELSNLLPGATIKRMDYDTAKTKAQYEDIIYEFEQGETDVLVGTQMITKGLDFDNVALVGILLADKILFFPDFRANERAFQLFTQVAGRAGRRAKKGKVLIQTFNPEHDVIQETLGMKYGKYYKRELEERKMFLYPPSVRLCKVTIKHKDFKRTEAVANEIAKKLRAQLGNRIIGPAVPGISRIRGKYIQQIMVKMEKDWSKIQQIKALLHQTKRYIKALKNMSTVQIIIDVDP